MNESTTNTAVSAPQAPGAVLAKPMSIKDTVIAQFQETEAGLQAMADRYRNVVYDVTTPKGMKEAIAARAELRDDGRRLLTRTAAKVKADVNELKEVMGTEVERLIAIVKPVEDAIDAQIKVEEKRKADEKAERDRKETERVEGHRSNIEKLRSYVVRAEGQPLDAIKGAIETLCALTFGEEWQEFAQEAQAARDNTVAALRSMVQREEQRIENENLRAQLAALQPTAQATSAPALNQQAQPAINLEAGEDIAAQPSAAQAGEDFAVDAWDDAPEGTASGAHPNQAAAAIEAPAPQAPAPAIAHADDGARIKLGDICDRIAPLSITAEGLAQLRFSPVATVKNSKLYRVCDLPAIRDAMVKHLHSIQTTKA